MNEEQHDFSTQAIAKATETLDEVVTVLIPNKLWNTSANRLYYACYHAVTALLGSFEIYPKSHSGTIRLFNLHFIKNGVIDNNLGDHYATVFSMRQSADY